MTHQINKKSPTPYQTYMSYAVVLIKKNIK